MSGEDRSDADAPVAAVGEDGVRAGPGDEEPELAGSDDDHGAGDDDAGDDVAADDDAADDVARDVDTADDDPSADSGGTTAGIEAAVPPSRGEFDWRGWLLVAVVVVSFVVLPVLVTLRPVRLGGFRTTYLLVPLLPALLLGATAVWVALRSNRG